MNSFAGGTQEKFKALFEKAGLLFPKGKRGDVNRRSHKNRRIIVIDNYMVVGGGEKRAGSDRRCLIDRRCQSENISPLSCLL